MYIKSISLYFFTLDHIQLYIFTMSHIILFLTYDGYWNSGIGMSVMHDANHGTYSKNKTLISFWFHHFFREVM